MALFSLNAVRFEDVRQAVVNFLRENGTYKAEFDFEGSNLAYQIDLTAFTTMQLSYQNTLTANNIFIDTTEIRKNAVSIAKRMGYRPKRKIASRFVGKLEFLADSTDADFIPFVPGDTITFPAKDTVFTSSPNGRNFLNIIPIILTFQSSILLSSDFIVLEGTFKSLSTFGTGKKSQTFKIDSLNVEEDNLNILVRKTNTDKNNNKLWTHAPSFFNVLSTDIYFLEEDIKDEFKPKIIFGDGILGKIPLITETIDVEYLETLGIEANDETGIAFNGTPSPSVINVSGSLILTPAIAGTNTTIEISDNAKSSGGKDAETLEDIQFNAPKFFSTAGRGVTKNDYITFISEFSSILRFFNVTGGPTLFPEKPNQLGKIYITAVPFFDDTDFLNSTKIYLSELEENEIVPQITENTVISTTKIFVKPTYIFLDLAPFIEVPTTFSSEEIQTTIANADLNFKAFVGNDSTNPEVPGLQGLEVPYRHSKSVASLTNTAGVTSAEIDITHNFIINFDSFYQSKLSQVDLPTIFEKDDAGIILFDVNNIPVTTPFIKKRTDIITDENSKRDLGNQEVIQITTVPDIAGSLGGKYINIYALDNTGTEIHYVIWFDVADGSTAPDLTGERVGATLLEVDIATDASADTVAIALSTAVLGIAKENHFSVALSSKVVTATLVNFGNVKDAKDGNVSEVTTITTAAASTLPTSGDGDYFILNTPDTFTNYYIWYDVDNGNTDPKPASLTGVEIDVTASDTADQVATLTRTAVDALVEFTVTGATDQVIVTNDNEGEVTDSSDVNTGFIFAITIQGLNTPISTGFKVEVTVPGKDTDFFNQNTLPISSSSIFGNLTHLNSKRLLHNIDVVPIEFITWELTGPVGNEALLFKQFNFKDKNNIEYIPNLIEIAGGTWPLVSWQIQLNGRNIGQLNQTALGIFDLTAVDETFLRDTVGVVQAENEVEFLKVDKITETDENNVVTVFYTLNFLLSNDVFTDIRINSKNKLIDASFDATTFLWTFTNPIIFTNQDERTATLSSVDPAALDENFFQIDHFSDQSATSIILSMKHFNGAFSLNNFVNNELNRYDQRNDLELVTNFTTSQEISEIDYEISAFSSTISNVQTITLNAKETTEVTVILNSGNVLDGTWFSLWNTLDAQRYYVWFDGTGNTPDPKPVNSGLGIRIVIDNGASATLIEIAQNLQRDVDAHTDFTAIVGKLLTPGTPTDLVTIQVLVNGKTTDTIDGAIITTTTVSAAILEDNGTGFTDETADANSATINDVSLVPAVPANNDAFYVAKDKQFNIIDFDLTNNPVVLNTATLDLAWEYWNGAWTPLSGVQDGTISGNAETTDITVLAESGITGADFFTIYSAKDVTQYHVWYDIDDGDTDPNPGGGSVGIEVDIATGWSANQVATATQLAIDALTDFTAIVASDKVTVTNVSNGDSTDSSDTGGSGFTIAVTLQGSGEAYTETSLVNIKWTMPTDWVINSVNSQGPFFYVRAVVTTTGSYTTIPDADQIEINPSTTGMTFDTVAEGADNFTVDIDKLVTGDLIKVVGSGSSGNDGFFQISSSDSIAGTVDVFNINGVSNIFGDGTITHYKVTGTYGSFTISTFDLFHNRSIGTLNYKSGILEFFQFVKGFTDTTDLTNKKVTKSNIKSIFNNYTHTGAPAMDKIKIVPIEKITSSGESLGKETDFDSTSSQSIQTQSSLPIIKTN